MKIVTWNVNSIKARLSNVLDYLREEAPDVVLLQETKTVDEAFPALEVEELGYNIALHGQKTYNGVAILSKYPIEDVQKGLPGNPDDVQARYIEGVIASPNPVRVASIYVPMGQAVGSEKYAYKIDFYDRLYDKFSQCLDLEEPVIMGGDYNVAPEDADVYDPEKLRDTILCSPEERARLRALTALGYTDAYRVFDSRPHQYSWWDYRAGAWNKDNGLRIDHLYCSPSAADRLTGAGIDRKPRGQEKASDHTPVFCTLTP